MDKQPTYYEFISALVRGWGRNMSGPVQFWLSIIIAVILFIAGTVSIVSNSTVGLLTTGFIAIGALHLTCYLLWAQERNKVVSLQIAVTPNLSISFESQEPWLIKLPTSNIPDPKTGEILQRPSWWVRVRIQNLSELKIAHRCRVFLQNVEFSPDDNSSFQTTGFSDSLQLRWAAAGNQPFEPYDISYAERRFIDVFSTDPVYNAILIKWNTDLIANQGLFSHKGIYRLTIIVSSEDAGSSNGILVVSWNGRWDEINVHIET